MEGAMTAPRTGARTLLPEESFRRMFSRHYGAVFAYAARRVGWDEAADCTAEVFTVAWRKHHSVPDEPQALLWLYGVARKVVSNQLRSRRRRDRLAAEAAATPRLGWSDDEPADLDAALAGLGEDDREVLMLAAWEGLTPTQMGRVLGCSANAASVRLHRARGRLSAAWDSTGGGR
jgi:RNA polymerase sigma-70 factor (ECF subfamily)